MLRIHVSNPAAVIDMFPFQRCVKVGSRDQVFNLRRPLQLVEQVLTVLQCKYLFWVELHFAKNRRVALGWFEQDVDVQIKWPLAFADLIFQPHDSKVWRRR